MQEQFNKIVKDASLVGATSLVYNKGEIVEKHNYGVCDLEKGNKVNSDTVFRIASVSKIIVALCIMKLYEEKKLDINEDISKYLGFTIRNPKYPNDKITLEMVMTQTSSITDGLELAEGDVVDTGYNLVNGTNVECSLQDLIDPNGKHYYEGTYSNYRPGEHFQYSNLGCGILACVTEKITGKYFTEYVKDVVFKPLNLDASFVVTDIKSDDVASTYVMRNGVPKKLRDRKAFEELVYDLFPLGDSFRGPAGGCFISANGLMKIMIAFLNGGEPILKKKTFDRMMQMSYTCKFTKHESYTAKGLQLQITDYFEGARLYGHFGDAYGVKSHFLFNQKEQLGMIFITNGGGYKYQECGYSDVQEKLINEVVKKYYKPEETSIFTFDTKEKIGHVLNRIVELDCVCEDNNIYINKNNLFDALGVNTLKDFDLLSEKQYYTIEEAIEKLSPKYSYKVEKEGSKYIISYNHL